MKKMNLLKKLGAIITVLSLISFGCKKNSTTDALTTLSSTEQAQITNSDSQDAAADKTEQDIDKTLDILQNNGYNSTNISSSLKSGSNAITITVDSLSSTTLKNVKIVFDNYVDSAGNENFVKNGEIDVVVTAPTSDKKLIVRTQTFKNFTVSTDSSSIAVSGTRVVKRTTYTPSINLTTGKLNLFIVDSIAAKLTYNVTSGTDTSSFTRIVAKQRTAFLHYSRLAPNIWKANVNSDTLKYTGVITGRNEKGYTYTKTVTAVDPFSIIFYNSKPVAVAGTMEYTVTDNNKETSSYTIKFSESDKTNHKSKITVVNDKTAKTWTLERKLGRKFRKW